jgi:hypothetical protein
MLFDFGFFALGFFSLIMCSISGAGAIAESGSDGAGMIWSGSLPEGKLKFIAFIDAFTLLNRNFT